MVARHEMSADRLTWTFTLRDGLEWHDGAAGDRRGLRRLAQALGRARHHGPEAHVATSPSLATPNARAIAPDLEGALRPGACRHLAKPGANVPFMMPKRVADTDPNTQITDYIGSGPFIFKQDEWQPGEKVVYVKNPKYKPRAEPRLRARRRQGRQGRPGRMDLDRRRADRRSTRCSTARSTSSRRRRTTCCRCSPPTRTSSCSSWNPTGRQYAFRFNVLHKPFDNPKVRQAVAYALNQKDFLDAVIGDPEVVPRVQVAVPVRLAAARSTKGWDDKLELQRRQGARRCCRRPATTARRSCSCSRPTSSSLSNLAPVAKSLLEKAGFKVDLQAMDWQTLVSRRTKKDPPSAGGWQRVPHLVGLGRRARSGRGQLPQRELRQGDVRLAVRRGA